MEERKSLEEIINGKNHCVKTFCVTKMAEGVSSYLNQGHFSFYREYEEHDNRMILMINVPLSICGILSEKYGIDQFLFVRLSNDGLSCEHYVLKFSDRLSYMNPSDKLVMVEKTDTMKLYKCRHKDKLELEGNTFDMRFPISCLKELAERIDNLASERKAKHPDYADRFDSWLNDSVADYGVGKHQFICRAKLWGINYEKWLNGLE